MKEFIDITMTSMLRPSLLSTTLTSIRERICKSDEDRYRLIINVDPLGEDVKAVDVVKTAKKNFKNVISNTPTIASFPKAVKWVWSQVTANYIFHIEDDWKFNIDIDVDKMIEILRKYEKLSSLRLYKYHIPERTKFMTFGCHWIYNSDGFYLAKDWRKQFGLNPILIKKEFIDQAFPKMVDNVNPEKQFRESQDYMKPIIKNWQYGIYGSPGDRPAVTDIGRKWINQTNFCKPKNETFLTWERK